MQKGCNFCILVYWQKQMVFIFLCAMLELNTYTTRPLKTKRQKFKPPSVLFCSDLSVDDNLCQSNFSPDDLYSAI